MKKFSALHIFFEFTPEIGGIGGGKYGVLLGALAPFKTLSLVPPLVGVGKTSHATHYSENIIIYTKYTNFTVFSCIAIKCKIE